MANPSAHNDLEIDVTDFGPIARASIDLRPLTVFVGPSNTGKSYLAILIYALHRHFGGAAAYQWRYFGTPRPPWRGIDYEPSPELVAAIRDLAREVANKPDSGNDESVRLPDALAEGIHSGFEWWGAAWIGRSPGASASKESRRWFGKDERRARRLFSDRATPWGRPDWSMV